MVQISHVTKGTAYRGVAGSGEPKTGDAGKLLPSLGLEELLIGEEIMFPAEAGGS